MDYSFITPPLESKDETNVPVYHGVPEIIRHSGRLIYWYNDITVHWCMGLKV